MKEVVKRIAPLLRSFGYRGSGQTYRRDDGAFAFVTNFQASRTGDRFLVNLGAQLVFVPAEGDANFAKLKEYDCIFRRRVGVEWPRAMSDLEFQNFQEQVLEAQRRFFGHVKTLPEALEASASPEALLDSYCIGTTRARATLHLARAAAKLGHPDIACELVGLGFALAGESASLLRIELNELLISLQS